ncbi:MAG TPA: hypothetical protein PKB15_02760 [Acidimicrobiia bacterium]|nr:hypothetical protein [Acidimicrobiia bacterium]
MTTFAVNTQWKITQEESSLIISGGQDAIFTIELDTGDPCFFSHAERPFHREDLSPSDVIILEQLLSANIVVPAIEVTNIQDLNIDVRGDEIFVKRFTANDDFFTHHSADDTDLVILIRSNESFADFLENVGYAGITHNHLFVDLAYNHVVSLGPLVFPGITSCVACLQGRITSRWGDPAPPESPASTHTLLDFTREWVEMEIKKLFQEDDYTLTNKTIVFDTQDRSMTHNKLLTVPLCPYCKRTGVMDGKIDLKLFESVAT